MNILAVDSAFENLLVGLKNNGKTYYKTFEKDLKKHNATLLPAIEELLNESSLKLFDIDYFAVNTGPGSFTGIRLGVCTINAFAFATGKKIIELDSFSLSAFNRIKGYDYKVFIDCFNGNFYGAEFKKSSLHKIKAGEYTENDINYDKDIVLKQKDFYKKENIIEFAEYKISRNEFTDYAVPSYYKKSQAERELDR